MSVCLYFLFVSLYACVSPSVYVFVCVSVWLPDCLVLSPSAKDKARSSRRSRFTTLFVQHADDHHRFHWCSSPNPSAQLQRLEEGDSCERKDEPRSNNTVEVRRCKRLVVFKKRISQRCPLRRTQCTPALVKRATPRLGLHLLCLFQALQH